MEHMRWIWKILYSIVSNILYYFHPIQWKHWQLQLSKPGFSTKTPNLGYFYYYYGVYNKVDSETFLRKKGLCHNLLKKCRKEQCPRNREVKNHAEWQWAGRRGGVVWEVPWAPINFQIIWQESHSKSCRVRTIGLIPLCWFPDGYPDGCPDGTDVDAIQHSTILGCQYCDTLPNPPEVLY